MHKEELIKLHDLMSEVKDYFEDANDTEFDGYDDLDVGPVDIHESKSEHKHAIFVLGQEMAESMADDEYSDRGRISARMEELADKNDDS